MKCILYERAGLYIAISNLYIAISTQRVLHSLTSELFWLQLNSDFNTVYHDWDSWVWISYLFVFVLVEDHGGNSPLY